MAISLQKMHNNECEFYKFISKSPSVIPIPEIYYIQKIEENSSGIIIMEDFSNDAFIVSFFDGLNEAKVII